MTTHTAANGFADFFGAVSQIAERRVAEKKAAAEAKKQSNLSILGRIQYKNMNVIRFGVEDRNDKHPALFRVTIIDGVVRSCENAATGETCDGRHWSGHCCHETRVMAYEAERAEQLAVASQVAASILGEQFASDLPAHIDDELSEQDEIERQRAAYRAMTPEQQRQADCVAFDLYGEFAA